MRVALMALTEESGAAVRLGGRPVAWHQLQAALALGCERVVCMIEAPGQALAALQRETEQREAKFHAIAHHRALSGLVSAADTLFAFAPGVLPDREWLSQALGARAGVVVLPADDAVERGFERIDRDRAWGGVLATRGDAVESLTYLPPDADPISGLLRVALQRGARCVEVPERWLNDGRWALLNDPQAAQRLEETWQARHVPAPAGEHVGEGLSHRMARMLLSRAADRPALAPTLFVGGAAVAIGGGVAGYIGHTLPGVVALALGTVISLTGERLGLFARAGFSETRRGRWPDLRDAALDLSLIAIAASPQEFAGWPAPFAAAVLIATMRLAREDGVQRPVRVLGDRALVFTLLALAAAAGAFVPAAAGLALTGLAGRLFWPRSRG